MANLKNWAKCVLVARATGILLALALGGSVGYLGQRSEVQHTKTNLARAEGKVSDFEVRVTDALGLRDEAERLRAAAQSAAITSAAQMYAERTRLLDEREATLRQREATALAAEAAARQQAYTQYSGSDYYENCDEARDAGVTPIYEGDDGYREELDRDGDGIACE